MSYGDNLAETAYTWTTKLPPKQAVSFSRNHKGASFIQLLNKLFTQCANEPGTMLYTEYTRPMKESLCTIPKKNKE